jgi:hypothetical protein
MIPLVLLLLAAGLTAGPEPAVAAITVIVHTQSTDSEGRVTVTPVTVTEANARELIDAARVGGSLPPMWRLVEQLFPPAGGDTSFRDRLREMNTVGANNVTVNLVDDSSPTRALERHFPARVFSDNTLGRGVWPHADTTRSGGDTNLWIGTTYMESPRGRDNESLRAVMAHEFAHTQDAISCRCSYGPDRDHKFNEILPSNRGAAWVEGLANYFAARESPAFRTSMTESLDQLEIERSRANYAAVTSPTFENFTRNEAFNCMVLVRLAELLGDDGHAAILAAWAAVRARGSTLAEFLPAWLAGPPSRTSLIPQVLDIINQLSNGTGSEAQLRALLGSSAGVRAALAGMDRIPAVSVHAPAPRAVDGEYEAEFSLRVTAATRSRARLDPGGPVSLRFSIDSAAAARTSVAQAAAKGTGAIRAALRSSAATRVTTSITLPAWPLYFYQLTIAPSGAPSATQTATVGIAEATGSPRVAASRSAGTIDLSGDPLGGLDGLLMGRPGRVAAGRPGGGGGGTEAAIDPFRADVSTGSGATPGAVTAPGPRRGAPAETGRGGGSQQGRGASEGPVGTGPDKRPQPRDGGGEKQPGGGFTGDE